MPASSYPRNQVEGFEFSTDDSKLREERPICNQQGATYELYKEYTQNDLPCRKPVSNYRDLLSALRELVQPLFRVFVVSSVNRTLLVKYSTVAGSTSFY